jgi:hypothetical protein
MNGKDEQYIFVPRMGNQGECMGFVQESNEDSLPLSPFLLRREMARATTSCCRGFDAHARSACRFSELLCIT